MGRNVGVNLRCSEIHAQQGTAACAICTLFLSVVDAMCVSALEALEHVIRDRETFSSGISLSILIYDFIKESLD